MTDTASNDRPELNQFWNHSPDDLGKALESSPEGLSMQEAADRLQRYGPNTDEHHRPEGTMRAIGRRLLEPLSMILLAAALVSMSTGDATGGAIIVVILGLSIGLDTFQEGRARQAADMLKASVAIQAEVRRDGQFRTIPVDEVVPGDVVRVRAGDIIPADALVLSSDGFTAGEAALTGEPYPVEKLPGQVATTAPAEASNALFRGAVAETGEALAMVVGTGRQTVFGAAAAAMVETQAPSPFQRDLHAFSLAMARLTLGLVVVVLSAHMMFGRPLLESLMFAVALAVGLTPELLPMITTVTLSKGALRMARQKVIVKRLASIHDLGAMTVLCTDKTGTLTEANISVASSLLANGDAHPQPALLGAVAADLGGDRGALDNALQQVHPEAGKDWTLLSRQAFDFHRRVGSVLARSPQGQEWLIVKGAPEAVFALCTQARQAGDECSTFDDQAMQAAMARVHALAEEGLRTVAVASRPWAGEAHELDAADETGLTLEGLCAFVDPPKATAAATIARLARAGIGLKILSGDDPVVVRHLAAQVGLKADRVLTGADMAQLSDAALAVQVQQVDAYGRLAPDQKSRIVRALQSRGAVVGFLGDGINDAPALNAADIGLSVQGASGVAQAAADMILLDSGLDVVADGVEEGRRTFVNILKYVRMGASSNIGNMLSMAVASLFLPFLPMLPIQILLNNLLYDCSEIGIPFDSVRPQATARPQVWDMHGLVRFAGVMGPLSSVFDLLTFGGLLYLFRAGEEAFRTAWFIESMATQILVIFVIRTAGRPWRDLPKWPLTLSSLAALAVALILPLSPLGSWLGFAPLSGGVLLGITLLVLAYLACAEALKHWAMRPPRHRHPHPNHPPLAI